MAEDWPSYPIPSREHLHAIGVLAVAWNDIEQIYANFFVLTIRGLTLNPGLTAFELMGNDSRWQYINEELPRILDVEETDHLRHFLKCAAICKENRNSVIHARVEAVEGHADLLRANKGRDRKARRPRRYWFSVAALRQMADECHATSEYGLNLFRYAALRRLKLPDDVRASINVSRPTLPQKPPVPRKWDLHSQPDPAVAPLRPQSSPE